MGFDPAKLQAFIAKNKGSNAKMGGKGSMRRKKKVTRKSTSHDDKKLKSVLNKLSVRDIPAIEEVNLFRDDGKVVHFSSPKVQASIASNTYVVSGNCETKELKDLLPDIMTQLGSDNIAELKKLYASYSGAGADKGEDSDDDVPDLVDNFEETSKGDDIPELVES